jgi:formylmethanofuran dehydrogenase subunit C
LIKAATDILAYSDITTNAGAITLWSDTDGGSARGGGIKTGAGNTISSTGGAISLSGGADNTTSWAKGTSITDDFGISLAGTVNAGGGNITIRGEEAADLNRTVWTDRAGVNLKTGSSTTTSGSGTITVDGKADATLADNTKFHHGVVIGSGDVGNATVISSAAGAISIKGDASANSGQNRRGILMYRASATTTSGAITLEGLGNSATGGLALHFYDNNNTVSSTSGGAILLKGNAGVSSTFFDGTVSSAGGVTLQVSSFTVYSGRTFNLAGASAKVIESTSTENSFGASVNLTGLTVSSDSTSSRQVDKHRRCNSW